MRSVGPQTEAILADSYTTSWTRLVLHTVSAPEQTGWKKNGSILYTVYMIMYNYSKEQIGPE